MTPVSFFKKLFKAERISIPEYVPEKLYEPERKLEVVSAWKGLELIIPDLMKRFKLEGSRCIEFGVEFGFSAVAFSNYFQQVVGVDTFEGDKHTMHKGDHFEQTRSSLEKYPNIELHKSRYQEWIKEDNTFYELAHVDIIHTYKDTYKCGLWAAEHSKCTLFHDTESFVEVRRAVVDIARKTGKKVYNYPHSHGLGIIAD